MLSSLSSVPPVWPRPRPEIIGTAPPQAATSGASMRLTLSPTPPVECLSSRGPGRLELDQSMTRPDWAMARVSVTRSPISMPRKNTAMAKAATCPSAIEPSVSPRTKNAISASSSAPPSRFLRMISWGMKGLAGARTKAHSPGGFRMPSGAIGEPLAEASREAFHNSGTSRGNRQSLLVAERRVAEADGEIGDGGDGGDAQAAMTSHDRLWHRRHADRVGAESAVGADLRGRL